MSIQRKGGVIKLKPEAYDEYKVITYGSFTEMSCV